MMTPAPLMRFQGRRWRWKLWLTTAIAVLVGVCVLVVVVVVLPAFLVHAPANAAFGDRARAENDIRSTLLTGLAGLAVAVGAVVGILNLRETHEQNRRTFELSRRGQVTERFTRAVDQLGQQGADRLDVRIGGIYALEQIARDSDELYGPILEILIAFLKEHAADVVDTRSGQTPVRTAVRLRADFQAMVNVLGRRDRRDGDELDLAGVSLPGAYFDKHAHFEGTEFVRAHLEHAIFHDAHLERANFLEAHLERASFLGADLAGAAFQGAHLKGADFQFVTLDGAIFSSFIPAAEWDAKDVEWDQLSQWISVIGILPTYLTNSGSPKTSPQGDTSEELPASPAVEANQTD